MFVTSTFPASDIPKPLQYVSKSKTKNPKGEKCKDGIKRNVLNVSNAEPMDIVSRLYNAGTNKESEMERKKNVKCPDAKRL